MSGPTVNGRKVLIGCTGSVAAIKVPILVQELVNIDDQVSPPTLFVTLVQTTVQLIIYKLYYKSQQH